jgi:hypothetical protein
MKKWILIACGYLLTGYNVISQTSNEHLLVATYEVKSSGKHSMCWDYALIQEKVTDRISFEKRRKEILQQYPGLQTVVRLIKPNEAVIVYEYEKSEPSWNCIKKIITVKTGKDLEYCKSVMEKDMVTRPKQFNSSPKAIFQRDVEKVSFMNCEDMVKYRDEALPKMLDKLTKKYKIQDEHIEYIKKLRTELETETALGTSNWNILPLTLKFAANTIEDAIGMATPKGYLMKIAKQAGAKVVGRLVFYEWVKKGKDALEAMTNKDTEEALANHMANEIGNLAPPVALIKRMNENLNEQLDFMETCKEVKKQLSSIEKAMTAYNAKLALSKKNLESFNQYKNYIDAYLIENCK